MYVDILVLFMYIYAYQGWPTKNESIEKSGLRVYLIPTQMALCKILRHTKKTILINQC